jgi:hypothetical protein
MLKASFRLNQLLKRVCVSPGRGNALAPSKMKPGQTDERH